MGLTRADNPYVPGFGAVPPALAGREPEFADVEAALARVRRGIYEQPRLLTGDRGMGKTAVLAELATQSRERGQWVVEVEASRSGNALVLLLRDLRALLWDHDRDRRVGEYARRALAVLSSFALAHADLRLVVRVDAAAGRADTGDLATDLGDVLVAACETAAAADAGLLLCVDEIQAMPAEQIAPLFVALQRLARHEAAPGRLLPILAVVAGLPGSRAAMRRASSTYAERVREHELGLLGEGAATEALIVPAEQRGVRYEPEALTAVVDGTGGYPFFVQLMGYEAWNAAADRGARSVINVEDAAAGIERARLEAARLYESRLAEVPDTERRYLDAAAGLDQGERRSAAIAAVLGGTSEDWAWARQRLIERGLLRPAGRGRIAFALPGLADYLRSIGR